MTVTAIPASVVPVIVTPAARSALLMISSDVAVLTVKLGAVVSTFGQTFVVVALPAASVAITVSSVEPVLFTVRASIAALLKA